MKRFAIIFLLSTLFFSCNTKSPALLIETFNSLSKSSDRVAVMAIKESYNEDTGRTLSKIEIRNLATYFRECQHMDSCGSPNGEIVFYKKNQWIGYIEFCTVSSSCQSLYVNSNGKLYTFQMRYRTGMMLDELLYEAK